MKVCTKCSIEKQLSDFPVRNKKTGLLRCTCRKCMNKANYDYCQTRKEEINDIKSRSAAKHKDKKNALLRLNHPKVAEAKKIKATAYRNLNRQKVRDGANAWYHVNKDKVFAKLKEKRHNDPLFRIKCKLKNRVHLAFKQKGWKKDGSMQSIVGIDYNTVKIHIERQFKPGMSWENYGLYTWHIDHIIPLAVAKNEEELKTLCHYTNLQPLWAVENIQKSDKVLPTQMVLTI